MKINVGSQNAVKIAAVHNTVALYPELLPDPHIVGVDVAVAEFGHPKNIEESVQGAIDRARRAFKDCVLSIGLEGGLIAVPHSTSGYLEVGVCAIFDGEHEYLGFSPAFEFPKPVVDMILQGEGDASVAFKKLGLTEHDKLGAVKGGIIGMLTNGRMGREDFTKYSIMMALIHLEQAEIYPR
jgi:inosine/xanthosine triphosphatase